MSWFIHKGEDLIRDQIIKISLFTILGKHFKKSDLIIEDVLLYSEDSEAPVYPGAAVKPCCELRSDLRSLNKKDLERCFGADGEIYYYVNYDLVLCPTDANLKFSLEFNGKEMGSVEATYV
jgi:hypothetical protein